MIYYVTCPCGCGHTFPFEVSRKVSEEERERRRAWANEIRKKKTCAGRPKGSKEKGPRKTRCDKGKPRLNYRKNTDTGVRDAGEA